jgi:hypothetical protein
VSERRQAAGDADAGSAGCGAQPFGDLLVREVGDDAQLDRLALAGRQVVERLVEPLEPALVRLRLARLAVEPLETPSRSVADRSSARFRTDASSTWRAIA